MEIGKVWEGMDLMQLTQVMNLRVT